MLVEGAENAGQGGVVGALSAEQASVLSFSFPSHSENRKPSLLIITTVKIFEKRPSSFYAVQPTVVVGVQFVVSSCRIAPRTTLTHERTYPHPAHPAPFLRLFLDLISESLDNG